MIQSCSGHFTLPFRADRSILGVPVILLFLLLALVGCGAERPALNQEELQRIDRKRSAQLRATRQQVIQTTLDRLECEYADWQPGQPAPRFDILVLSGGAAWGAYGAAYLNAWRDEVPADDPKARPDNFDIVTGVSTGSLIGTYVYLDEQAADERIESIYREADPEWAKMGFWWWWPTKESMVDNSGLIDFMHTEVTTDHLTKMARQRQFHRQFLVSAVDIDVVQLRIWELGAMARDELAGDEAPGSVVKRLMASTSIPGGFPPVRIDGTYHADGGIIEQLHPGITLAQWHTIVDRWQATHPDKPLPQVRYWVILNTWIRPPKQAVDRQWPIVAARSVQVMMAANVHYPLDRIASACQYLRDAYDMDAQMYWTGIPADYAVPESEHAFDPLVTNFLADTGAVQGSDPIT
jgi:hypothetical protein